MRKYKQESLEQVSKSAHDFIQEFLTCTKNKTDEVTLGTKAIIAQFLDHTRSGLREAAAENEWISGEQFANIQMDALRGCILAVNCYLKSTESMQ